MADPNNADLPEGTDTVIEGASEGALATDATLTDGRLATTGAANRGQGLADRIRGGRE